MASICLHHIFFVFYFIVLSPSIHPSHKHLGRTRYSVPGGGSKHFKKMPSQLSEMYCVSLRKLAVFDTWSRLVVHVAMDNTVVIEEISECFLFPDFA